MPKVHILPLVNVDEPDSGQGGIGRVVRGQYATLAQFGWEIVETAAEADLIACHVEIPAAYLRLYGDKPFVVHNHGLYWTDGGYWWPKWCYQVNQYALSAIRAATAVTAVSQWTAQAIRRATMRDVRVIYHGVDLDEWTVPDSHRGYVLWNKTRVDAICNPAPMNAAARLLPDVPFVSTFGDPAPNVELTDKVSYEQGKELVRRAGVYLCTTRETFGIGTLEALAAGVPVVGYDFGGQAEIIEHGVDGWLVRPGDEAGLAEGIRWALANRAAISPRARAKAAQFPVAASGEAYARLYNEVLARHRRDHAQPRTTIVVPAYKMGDYLDDTLRSIQAQTDPSWECVVVNDASPDERDHEIAQRYVQGDARFREIVLEQNGYLANARNVGIAAANGRYIFPLDADDQITPTTIAMLADALDADPSVHIAYGNVLFVEHDGRTPKTYAGNYGAGHSGWPVPFNLEVMLRGPGQLVPVASMFRRTVWEQTGGYRTRCRSSEDQDFWLRACSYGFTPRMVTTADTLIYRVRADSMSATTGWEEHRGWFPWCSNRALLPAGAVQDGVGIEAMPMPALDPAPIAVVIPVGPGHGAYVIDAIDSVDAQTFRNWECIVVNDSGEPLPLMPSWVRVLCSDPACPDQDGGTCHSQGADPMPWPRARGVAVARNKGVRASRAAMFLPLDADDYLQPQALELMWANAVSESEPAVIYSDFYEDPLPLEPGTFRIYNTPDYDPRKLIRNGALHAVTALTPRIFWEEVGGYPEDLPWEDWAFAIAIAAKGRCSRRIAAPLFTYRKRTGMRRNENHEDFEASKRAMMTHDFGLQKGGELLACSSCGGRQTQTQTFTGFGHTALMTAGAPPEDAVLLRYKGSHSSFPVRSAVNPSVRYNFSNTYPDRYVHKADAARLLQRNDFELVAASPAAAVAAQAPAIVAAREPVMVGAVAGASGAGPIGVGAAFGLVEPDAPLVREDAQADTPPSAEPPVPLIDLTAPAEPSAFDRAMAGRPQPPMDRQREAAAGLAEASTRETLNSIAEGLGIENILGMKTKFEVATAIVVAREMRGL